MVFPSAPVYLDLPNWNHQQPHQQGSGGGVGAAGGGRGEPQQQHHHHHHQELPPPGAVSVQHPDAGMTSSARPVSMAERARLAKVPQPEPALKCPRCDSINTKFCYFNNYSLSQPRHFCKTCRRYWTRGGALRNVPVGGGCRRNKRSKSSGSGSSKSTATNMQAGGASSSSSTATSSGTGPIPSNVTLAHQQLPFMASLHPLTDYGSQGIGLNFGGMQPMDSLDYQIGSSSSVGMEHWRLQQIQQFPFFGGMDPQAPAAPAPPVSGLFSFDGDGGVDAAHQYTKASGTGLISQFASVKMEDSSQGLNFSRQYMSNINAPRNDHQYWGNNGTNGGGGGGGGGGGSGWTTDLSGFNSSSGGNLL